MRRPLSLSSSVSALSLAVTLALVSACQDNIPSQPEFARTNNRYNLTITGSGSAAAGTVTSDRGGISCAVQAGGRVSGKCSQGFKSGAIVNLTTTPGAGATVGLVSSTCAPLEATRWR